VFIPLEGAIGLIAGEDVAAEGAAGGETALSSRKRKFLSISGFGLAYALAGQCPPTIKLQKGGRVHDLLCFSFRHHCSALLLGALCAIFVEKYRHNCCSIIDTYRSI
jgi:hypothetical protein